MRLDSGAWRRKLGELGIKGLGSREREVYRRLEELALGEDPSIKGAAWGSLASGSAAANGCP